MFTVHATRKLLERVKAPVQDPVEDPTPVLGNWYATAVFGRPQVALFVNEAILVSVLLPLAPAKTLIDRFPEQLGHVLTALGSDPRFVAAEVAATVDGRYARTASRSRIGIMNEFTRIAERRQRLQGVNDLIELAAYLANVPCSPLYATHTFPNRALAALVAAQMEAGSEPSSRTPGADRRR